MNDLIRRLGLAVGLVAAFGCLVTGCGGSDGPPRYDLSGKVDYGGKPVPAGRIALEPDGAKGNSGPPAYAEIKDGRYATPGGKGSVGGPHRVRITGFDGQGSGESPEGARLFSEYRTTAELPKEDGTLDFGVPAAHK